MSDIVSTDPRTGETVEVVAQETTTEEVDRLCTAALAAAPGLDALGRGLLGDDLHGLAGAGVGADDVGHGCLLCCGAGGQRMAPTVTRSTVQARVCSLSVMPRPGRSEMYMRPSRVSSRSLNSGCSQSKCSTHGSRG